MSRRRATTIVVGATVLGLIVGAAFSGEAVVALDVWLGASAVLIAAVAVRELLAASPAGPSSLLPAWSLPQKSRAAPEPADVQRIQTLLAASDSNPRFFARRLRPELTALAAHFLPRRHGFPPDDRFRVLELLGDVAWLIDPSVTGRSPQLHEVERFISLLLGEREPVVSR